jgi:gliding motility-associated protein GldC
MSSSEINIKVSLDDNKVPETMLWSASDAGIENASSKALILAMWDEKAKNTLRMDLWTKEMSVEEMKQFFHQTLLTMADTFERATGDTRITGDMRDFCYYFAERMNLLEK